MRTRLSPRRPQSTKNGRNAEQYCSAEQQNRDQNYLNVGGYVPSDPDSKPISDQSDGRKKYLH
jgi:hypothetical protein